MYKINRIMRLSHEAGRSQREIARACGLSQPSVQRVLKRAWEAGLALKCLRSCGHLKRAS